MYTTIDMKVANKYDCPKRTFGCLCSIQGITKRCRLSLLTNSALLQYTSPNAGGGGSCGVSVNEYSCAQYVTWSSNKLWRSTSIFNLWFYTSSPIQELILNNNKISRVTDIRQVERHRPIKKTTIST